MNLLKTLPLSAALVAAVVAAPGAAQAQGSGAEQFVPSDTLCRIGAYRSPGGDLVSLTRREKGYRYVFPDGRAGYLPPRDGPGTLGSAAHQLAEDAPEPACCAPGISAIMPTMSPMGACTFGERRQLLIRTGQSRGRTRQTQNVNAGAGRPWQRTSRR